MNDLEIFHEQTDAVRDFVKAEKLNLATELTSYGLERPIEIAHIDAAKSLNLWKSIFRKISGAIIPNKTIWIFQDFERCRLPWQAYSLAEILKFGEIIGGANYGTTYFKLHAEISSASRQKIINDDFSLAERIKNVKSIFDAIRHDHMSFFSSEKIALADIENTMVAYCYYWAEQKDQAKEILEDTSATFLSIPGNEIYSKEINSDDL